MHSYTETNFLLRAENKLAKEKGLKEPNPYPKNVRKKLFVV